MSCGYIAIARRCRRRIGYRGCNGALRLGTSGGGDGERRVPKSEIAWPKARAPETSSELPAPRTAAAREPASQWTRIVYLAALFTALVPTVLSAGLGMGASRVPRGGRLAFCVHRCGCHLARSSGHPASVAPPVAADDGRASLGPGCWRDGQARGVSIRPPSSRGGAKGKTWYRPPLRTSNKKAGGRPRLKA